jgi:hypothetical protein
MIFFKHLSFNRRTAGKGWLFMLFLAMGFENYMFHFGEDRVFFLCLADGSCFAVEI